MKNAICKKEVQLLVRNKKNAIGLLLFNLVLSAVTLFVFRILFEQKQIVTYADCSQMLKLYVLIMAVEMCMIAFIVPAITAGTISGEKEKQTLDILFTTSMSSREVVLGKIMSVICVVMLYVVSAFPVLFVVFAIGGVKIWYVIKTMCYIFVFSVYFGSFGIFFSSVFKKSVVATIWTYGAILFVTVGVHFITVWAAALCGKGVNVPVNGITALELFSPLGSALELFCSQIENGDFFAKYWYLKEDGFWWGNVSNDMWFVISVAVQLLTTVLLLIFAGKRLNPIKDKRKKGEHGIWKKKR